MIAAPLHASPAAPEAARRWLDDHQAAAYLGLSVTQIRKLGYTGAIPRVELGRSVRYDRRDLDAYARRNKVTRARS